MKTILTCGVTGNAGLLKAKPAEVRDFLAGTLSSDRTREFTEQLRRAGIPV